jgi:hypothetical protein
MTGTASTLGRPRGRALIALFAATAALAGGTAALAPAPAAAVTSEGGDCFTVDTLLFKIECDDLDQGGGLGSGSGTGPVTTPPADGGSDQQPFQGMVPVGNGDVEPYKGNLTKQDLIELGVLTPDGEPDLGLGPKYSPDQIRQLEEESMELNRSDPECLAISAELSTAIQYNEASELPDYTLEKNLSVDYKECVESTGMRPRTSKYGKRRLGPRPKRKWGRRVTGG